MIGNQFTVKPAQTGLIGGVVHSSYSEAIEFAAAEAASVTTDHLVIRDGGAVTKVTPAGDLEAPAPADWTAPVSVTLEQAKIAKIVAISKKTVDLIDAAVFVYAGKAFRLTPDLRVQYMQMDLYKDQLPDPLRVLTADATEFYPLNNGLVGNEVSAFVQAGMTVVSTIIQAGNDLVELVQAATTVSEVEAVGDNR